MLEADIKYEGAHFFVIFNAGLHRFEVCKNEATHSRVVGYGDSLDACIRTAKRLEAYPNAV